MVWLFNPTKKLGRSPKLQVKWEKEPFRVMDTLSDMVIRIERLDRRKAEWCKEIKSRKWKMHRNTSTQWDKRMKHQHLC